MKRIIIVGGGAAGMMAAAAVALEGCLVDLYEKNEKLGKKLYITGKGRCNLTNACDPSDFLSHVCRNGKFLYSSFYRFSNEDAAAFFEDRGLTLKTERGGRVFPASDHSSDVIRTLSNELTRLGVRVHLNCPVKSLITADDNAGDNDERKVTGVVLSSGEKVQAGAVIVCTGGLSYPSTGSTGDGYRMASACGHNIIRTRPSLVPMNAQESDAAKMQGLSLKNVSVRFLNGKKCLYEGFGEMMFTHFGVTGPLVLQASAFCADALEKGSVMMYIDLKSALTPEQLDARVLREFDAARNRQAKNVLTALYPSAMVPVMLERSGIPPEKKVNEIDKESRRTLVRLTKALPFTITGLRGFSEAVITRGGIKTGEISPDTMASKLVKGLYFAGEVLDLDAFTGGFNLQIAWTTGYAAGKGAAKAL